MVREGRAGVNVWENGAAGGNRTPDIQLGKLTFYL